ncbi:MAG: GNAT family N-acetyltransferase [Acidobacteriota bacterium]
MTHSTGPEATQPRDAVEADIDSLADLWHEGWCDAHADIVPADLRRLRTLASFRERLRNSLASVRVVGPPGSQLGFHMVKAAELNSFYVSRAARGTGVGATLMADAEARLFQAGVETAWLACAIGNDRAARFYEKTGWRRTGTMINEAETSEGLFPVETWRYEKVLVAGRKP